MVSRKVKGLFFGCNNFVFKVLVNWSNQLQSPRLQIMINKWFQRLLQARKQTDKNKGKEKRHKNMQN